MATVNERNLLMLNTKGKTMEFIFAGFLLFIVATVLKSFNKR